MATRSQRKENTLLHLFTSGCGGKVSAIFTCPLEVIKTRLQSLRLALCTFYYLQVHLGTITGARVIIKTGLQKEGTKYKSFVQMALLVFLEEGYLAFSRGLFAQLVWKIPNTAIMLSTYELIVYLLEDRRQ
ncbi:Solute carrier family 25 member 33 [Fukomys damarensis]|uniref:Solute carrier family 25 member 33 n=1 Tax=Fukomys damarensis TaxID=885580 RepID=A0A091CV26_FUKDA|nr:Solute carrier family 25 member 33 [Fukomys damarensis]